MMPTLSTIWSPATRELGNHLWQSTLFACVVALLAMALRNYSARTRYWLWTAASTKFLIPFFLLIAAGSHFARVTHATPARTNSYLAIDAMSQPFTDTSVLDSPVAPQPASPHQRFTWPAVLVTLWFLGFAALLTSWSIQWRRIANLMRRAAPLREGRVIETLRRIEQLSRIPRPIAVLSSHDPMEPGVFGVFRPVLLWPEAISSHLDDAHLEAVLAHEAAHVRRRDSLTSLIHMLVEAIFWFHPLVWWMESQLVKERERSCDEDVLLLCRQPQAYALGDSTYVTARNSGALEGGIANGSIVATAGSSTNTLAGFADLGNSNANFALSGSVTPNSTGILQGAIAGFNSALPSTAGSFTLYLVDGTQSVLIETDNARLNLGHFQLQ